MRIITKEFKKEDGTKVCIVISGLDNYRGIDWTIADVQYKKPRQRDWRFLSKTYIDNYEYRMLDSNKRKEYENNTFEEFCGKDKIIEAFQYAYESIRPSCLDPIS